jgi:hypothetical protein
VRRLHDENEAEAQRTAPVLAGLRLGTGAAVFGGASTAALHAAMPPRRSRHAAVRPPLLLCCCCCRCKCEGPALQCTIVLTQSSVEAS